MKDAEHERDVRGKGGGGEFPPKLMTTAQMPMAAHRYQSHGSLEMLPRDNQITRAIRNGLKMNGLP